MPRLRARQDIDEALNYYVSEASDEVALQFIDALEAAYRHLLEHPASGSLRYSYELDLPGLRTWPLQGFPWLIFYRDTGQQVDVWRVLHGNRDIPTWMGDVISDN